MEIVALYVPVLTEKTNHMHHDTTRLYTRFKLLYKELSIWADFGFRIL